MEKEFNREAGLVRKLAPGSSALHLALARTHIHLGDFDAAEAAYRAGLAVATDKTAFHMELGGTYLERGKLEAASEQYLQALRRKDVPGAQ